MDNRSPEDRTVEDRVAELRNACRGQSVEPARPEEPVAHLVPQRNIETWIRFFLQGPPVDEHHRYSHLARPSDAAPAAQAFARHARAETIPADAPPSVVIGLAEFRRVL